MATTTTTIASTIRAHDLIDRYLLSSHPEGGYYARIYQDTHLITQPPVMARHAQTESDTRPLASSCAWTQFPRPVSSAIFYLLQPGQFSCFHRLVCDEHWMFLGGQPIDILQISEAGQSKQTTLGSIERGYEPWIVIPANSWFAAYPDDRPTPTTRDDSSHTATTTTSTSTTADYSFLCCFVSGSFSFEEFVVGKRAEMLQLFPQHSAIIHKYCKEYIVRA